MERRNRSFLLILLFLVGGVPAELKRAVVVAVAPTRFLSASDLRTPRR